MRRVTSGPVAVDNAEAPRWKSIGRALRLALLLIVLGELVLRLVLREPPMQWLPAPFRVVRHLGLSIPGVHPESGVLTTWLRARYVTARKARGTYRIVVCGSSAVYGHGAPITASIPWQLERRLQEAVPGRRWEVVNLGQPGLSSAVHALNVRDAVAGLDPDLVVAIIGNNEYLPLMAYRSRFPGYDSRTDSMNGLLRESWLYGTLYQLVMRRLETPRVDTEADARAVGLEQIDAHDHRLVEQVYRRNLADICRFARDGGVPVVLCTVPRNRQWAPSSVNGRIDPLPTDWQAKLDESRGLRNAGSPQQALEIAEALDRQRQHALVRYERGMCLAALDRNEEARKVLDEAMVLDRHPRRASARFADIVQQVSAQCGVPVCDLAAALDGRAPNGMPGESDFLDACHFSPSGNRKVAEILVDFLLREGIVLASGSARNAAAAPISGVPSLEEWPGFHAYFRYSSTPENVRQLARQYPLGPNFSRRLPRIELAACTSADVARVYGHILAADDAVDAALACYLRGIELTSTPTPSQYLEAGLMAVIGGRFQQARDLLSRSDARDPTATRLRLLAAEAREAYLPRPRLPAAVPAPDRPRR